MAEVSDDAIVQQIAGGMNAQATVRILYRQMQAMERQNALLESIAELLQKLAKPPMMVESLPAPPALFVDEDKIKESIGKVDRLFSEMEEDRSDNAGEH